jgi:hypothetical protein
MSVEQLCAATDDAAVRVESGECAATVICGVEVVEQ